NKKPMSGGRFIIFTASPQANANKIQINSM
ncbi:MAG: hypothetical protein ACI8Q3_001746, partial [Marinomonas primoryensis]